MAKRGSGESFSYTRVTHPTASGVEKVVPGRYFVWDESVTPARIIGRAVRKDRRWNGYEGQSLVCEQFATREQVAICLARHDRGEL
jgi:hypothetical protein